MAVEEWRPAPRVSHWEVSSLGRLRTDGGGKGPARFLHGTVTANGYIQVKPGRRRNTVRLHRLVCEAFHGPAPHPRAVVRHLNDQKLDNRAANLAWGTQKDNHADAVRNGVAPPVPAAKRLFSPEQVVAIRAQHATGRGFAAIARDWGVGGNAIRLMCNGTHYADIPMAGQ